MKSLKNILIVGPIILILNLIWEFNHYFLYNDLSGIPNNLHLIIASFTDMIIILGIFIIITLIKKDKDWINHPNKNDYLTIAIIGIVIAVIIELINLKLKRWSYTSLMPTILGIGLSPLIQLSVTGIVSLFTLYYLKKNSYIKF